MNKLKLNMEENFNKSLKEIFAVIMHNVISNTFYHGIKTLKCPLDFWVYQEIIFDLKPDVIIEIGNYNGGSTLALAHIFDTLNKGKIIGIDKNHDNVQPIVRDHPRISLITEDACSAFKKVKNSIKEGEKVLIIEDSSGTYENTLNVLRTFSPLVTKGSYFIVEDGIPGDCFDFDHDAFDFDNDHGHEHDHDGVSKAIEEFVNECKDFEIDRSKEKYVITLNPKGYLIKVK